MYQFVPNFLSCVSAKYYLNWFAVGKVITKIIKGELFIKTQCIFALTVDSNTVSINEDDITDIIHEFCSQSRG